MTLFVSLAVGWCSYEAVARACNVDPPPSDDEVVVIDGSGPTSTGSTTSTGVGGAGTGGSSGTGGNPQCRIYETCGFGIPHVYPIPTTPTTCSTCPSYGEQSIDLEAMVYIAEFMTNCQADCPELSELTLEFKVHCETLGDKTDPALSLKHTLTYVESNPQLGRNPFSLEFLLDFVNDAQLGTSNSSQFNPDGAKCDVYGTATLELSDGTIVESECASRTLGFVPNRPIEGGPIIDFSIDTDAAAAGWDPPPGWQPEFNGATSVAGPGQQTRRVLSITNHATEDMDISLDVVAQNSNDVPTVTSPSGLVGTWDVSADGANGVPGDAFPVSLQILPDNVDAAECLTLPADPGSSEEQADSLSAMTLAPGETVKVEYAWRAYTQCGCGTNGSWTAALEAQWGSNNLSVDLGGNDVVDLQTPPSSCPGEEPPDCNGGADCYPSAYTCQDSGGTPPGDPCDDEDPELGECPGGGPIGASGKLPDELAKGLAEQLGADLGADHTRPTDEESSFVGAIFSLNDEAKVHVTKPLSEIAGVVTIDANHRANRFNPEVVRLVEFFDPDGAPDGDTLSVTVPLSVVQELNGELLAFAKLATGEKQLPTGALPHSFVTMIRTQVDSSPAMQIEIMVQVTAWARNTSTGTFEPVVLTSDSMAPTASGIDLAFEIEVPSFETDTYQMAYDVRSYRWTDYEQDCEDGTDNDADSFTDCDDPDCAEHPLCYDDEGNGAGGTSNNGTGGTGGPLGANTDDGSCGCHLVGSTTAPAPIALGTLLSCLLLLGGRRRRRQDKHS